MLLVEPVALHQRTGRLGRSDVLGYVTCQSKRQHQYVAQQHRRDDLGEFSFFGRTC